ncbi:MAG: sodium:solute symporter [Chitinophagales bacterium]
MSPQLLLIFVAGYFLLLLVVAYFTSKNSTNEAFFNGNKNSNWMLVAFGMIGTSLSGVTFVSVPGTVGNFDGEMHKAFGYMQVVIGYFLGYIVIAYVLLPLYYKLNLTSIYDYLDERFGAVAHKTGSLFFIISRTIGATARLYLVINVIQIFILDGLGVPFTITALIILLMILLYTFEGGVKTIVYTDTLQTTFMLAGLIICIVCIMQNLNLHLHSSLNELSSNGFTNIFNFDINSKSFFIKQIIGGMFITISMTGLDQEMMQKNISVKTLKNSRKNVLSFSLVLVIVNFLFLLLGGLLYVYLMHNGGVYDGKTFISGGKNIIGDDVFPTVALQLLPSAISLIFIIALISALFPSADGALTALTSSFCIDMLAIKKRQDMNEQRKKRLRKTVHICFAFVFLICILVFKAINDKSIIGIILDLASYTYGPLLGLFAFGIITRRNLKQGWPIVAVCFISPLICYVLSKNASLWFNGYQIGIELLLINGILTFTGLYLISTKTKEQNG